MGIVKQFDLHTEFIAQVGKELRNREEIWSRFVNLFTGSACGKRRVHSQNPCPAIDSHLATHHLKPLLDKLACAVFAFYRVASAGVGITHHAVTRFATEELVHRQACLLTLNIPEREVNRRQCRHKDRTPAPVALPIDQMPQVLDALRVAPQ
ncbi:MAG: hypothetical protein OHK0029_17240 [Armatimonadaceae bacterium]